MGQKYFLIIQGKILFMAPPPELLLKSGVIFIYLLISLFYLFTDIHSLIKFLVAIQGRLWNIRKCPSREHKIPNKGCNKAKITELENNATQNLKHDITILWKDYKDRRKYNNIKVIYKIDWYRYIK